jgi:hypothetical protein
MTTTQRKARAGASTKPANCWRIERIPGRPAHRTETGRIELPLWLSRNGRHVADASLTMTLDEAAELRAHLDQLIYGDTGTS